MLSTELRLFPDHHQDSPLHVGRGTKCNVAGWADGETGDCKGLTLSNSSPALLGSWGFSLNRGRGGLVKGAPEMSVAPPGGQDRIMIYGPKSDGTYIIEFPNICSSLPEPCGMSCRASCDERKFACLQRQKPAMFAQMPLFVYRHFTGAVYTTSSDG